MARFLVDEDLSRSLVAIAGARGLDAVHAVDAGLRSMSDKEIVAAAVAQQRSIVTADREFGNPLLYPPWSHAGVILVRIPEALGLQKRLERVADALSTLAPLDLHGVIAVVEPARTRLRRFRQ